MHIISRYLILEFIKTSTAVLVVLLLMMMGNTLVSLLHRAAAGDIASGFIAPLLLLGLANYLVIFLGLSFYLGMIMAFGRLYKDQEMAALIACGARPLDFVRPVLALGLLVALLVALLTMFAVPKLINMQYSFSQKAKQKSIDTLIKSGEFSNLGDTVIYAGAKLGADGEYADVFIANTAADAVVYQLAARAVLQQQADALRADLYQGSIYRQRSADIIKMDYRHYQSQLPAPKLAALNTHVEGFSSAKLWADDSPAARAELQWRMALPVAVVLLLLLAFPLSHTSVRKGAQAKLALGVLVYLVYSNLLSYSKNLIANENASIGYIWLAHLPLCILVIYMYGLRSNLWARSWARWKTR